MVVEWRIRMKEGNADLVLLVLHWYPVRFETWDHTCMRTQTISLDGNDIQRTCFKANNTTC